MTANNTHNLVLYLLSTSHCDCGHNNSALPRELAKRTELLVSREVADSLWRHHAKITMPPQVTAVLRDIHHHLLSHQPWPMLIGHLVPRNPGLFLATDVSKQGVGVNDTTQTWCFLPIHPDTARRLDLPAKHLDNIDINIFEFIGLLLAFVMAHLSVLATPSQFPPTPILHTYCDNTSAIAWLSKISMRSLFGQALLHFFTELSLLTTVGAPPKHLAGHLNFPPDLISRPCELYSPHGVSPLDHSFYCHVTQICQHLPKLKSWRIFLPSADLLSNLSFRLSSDVPSGRPLVPKNLGRFVPVGSISAGSSPRSEPFPTFSL
jgi:hypothetical protein